jgi:hypothetical protein
MSEPLTLPGLDAVVTVVADLAASFEAAGHRLHLVGGVVRDLLLGAFTAVDDIDLTTDAHPARIKALLAPHATDLWTQGERFGTIGARVNGRDLEVTTHRAEAYDPASRKPVVSFGDSIEQDLSRRDFTINAMALRLDTGAPELIDPYGGAVDLVAKRLRTPLDPHISFNDDNLGQTIAGDVDDTRLYVFEDAGGWQCHDQRLQAPIRAGWAGVYRQPQAAPFQRVAKNGVVVAVCWLDQFGCNHGLHWQRRPRINRRGEQCERDRQRSTHQICFSGICTRKPSSASDTFSWQVRRDRDGSGFQAKSSMSSSMLSFFGSRSTQAGST